MADLNGSSAPREEDCGVRQIVVISAPQEILEIQYLCGSAVSIEMIQQTAYQQRSYSLPIFTA